MADVNLWLLVGIGIIIVGFAMKLDSIAVVLVAAVVTALIGGMNFMEILETLGSQFVRNRGMSIFILTLPVVGMSERYGLREQAVALIQRMSALTAGRVIWLYQVVRQAAAALSLRLGGHPQFIRPLVHPMAEGAAIADRGGVPLNDEEADTVKGAAAAAENYGNFFGQNLFPASSGVTLIVSTLTDAGIHGVSNVGISAWSMPVFISAVLLGGVQMALLDRKIKSGGKN